MVVMAPILDERLLQISVRNLLFESSMSLCFSMENAMQVRVSAAVFIAVFAWGTAGAALAASLGFVCATA